MIPTDFDQLSPEWFTDVMRAGRVTDVAWQRIGEGVGLLGRLARVELTWADGVTETRPATVIVKLPTDIEEMAAQAQMFGFYDREINFYREIGDRASVRVPHAHHVDAAAEVLPFVIVMEDLRHARIVDQLVGCDTADAVRVARAAARLHGPWWGKAELHDLTWLPAVNGPLYSAGQPVVIDSLDTFNERWGDAVGVDGRQLALDVAHNLNNLQNRSAELGPLTMCHYDLRLDNLLFDDDASDVCVIDFQLMGTHRGPFDLAYFIAWSLTAEQRSASLDAIVDGYVDELGAAGISVEANWVLEVLREGLLNVVAMATLSGATAVVENDRGEALIEALVHRTFAAAADLDAAALL